MKVDRVKDNQFRCHTEKISLRAITIIVIVSSPLHLPVGLLYLIVMKIIIYYHRLHRYTL